MDTQTWRAVAWKYLADGSKCVVDLIEADTERRALWLISRHVDRMQAAGEWVEVTVERIA